jgi:hypothetical protein
MGEYAIRKSDKAEIKIGTCEQMYYLRADQVGLILPLSGSVNPARIRDAESIRFRFPFPQEDNIKPGDFDNFDYGLGLYGVEPPEDIDHHSLQFTRNYPQSGGVLLSIPCPRSKEGKEKPMGVSYNGYAGPVHIHSQRLVNCQLVLILRCGDCGALYRVPTLEECQPVLDILEKEAKQRDHETRIANERPGAVQCVSSGDYYREVARRIVAGYTDSNFWHPTRAAEKIAA